MIDPKKIVDNWDIRPEMRVADFGCGSGHYSLEVAKRVGGDGMVYAFDIQPEVLSALRGSAKVEHLANLEVRQANLEIEKGTGLSDELLDFVILSNVLFQTENDEAIIKEVSRVLRQGGQVAVIDWIKNAPTGPPKDVRISKESVRGLCEKNNLFYYKEFDADVFHYGIMFKKS